MKLTASDMAVQDLSMGWLRCDPDDMFKPHVYTGPAVYSKLAPIAQVLVKRIGVILPLAVSSFAKSARVVAAPMQVTRP